MKVRYLTEDEIETSAVQTLASYERPMEAHRARRIIRPRSERRRVISSFFENLSRPKLLYADNSSCPTRGALYWYRT